MCESEAEKRDGAACASKSERASESEERAAGRGTGTRSDWLALLLSFAQRDARRMCCAKENGRAAATTMTAEGRQSMGMMGGWWRVYVSYIYIWLYHTYIYIHS